MLQWAEGIRFVDQAPDGTERRELLTVPAAHRLVDDLVLAARFGRLRFERVDVPSEPTLPAPASDGPEDAD